MGWKGLKDEEREAIRKHLPKEPARAKGGRPRADDRKCFEGILWIAWSGAPWGALPKEYGSPTTCWRRLNEWETCDVLLDLWRAFLAQLSEADKLDWDECFADGSFVSAKKGAKKSAKPSAAREQSGWWWSMARVLRLEHTWSRHRQRK